MNLDFTNRVERLGTACPPTACSPPPARPRSFGNSGVTLTQTVIHIHEGGRKDGRTGAKATGTAAAAAAYAAGWAAYAYAAYALDAYT